MLVTNCSLECRCRYFLARISVSTGRQEQCHARNGDVDKRSYDICWNSDQDSEVTSHDVTCRVLNDTLGAENLKNIDEHWSTDNDGPKNKSTYG